MVQIKFKKDSIIKLVPIHIRKDKKNYIVEDAESGDFYEMPEVCIKALGYFNQGLTIEQTKKELLISYPDEASNIYDFTEQLIELNLVSSIDGHKMETIKKTNKVTGYTWIPEPLGKFFFNRATRWVYPALFVSSLLLIAIKPQLTPYFMDIFIFDSITLSMLFWLGATLLTILIHEFGHILALRAHNLPAKLGISHRLIIIVFETDMSAAWSLNRKNRNFLFLSGLCFDTVILFSALSLQLVMSGNPQIIEVLKMLVLNCILRMGYQCGVYMKTDLYYVIENVTGVYNLMESTNEIIKEKLSFKKKKEILMDFPGEKKTILFYSAFYLIGIIATLSLFVIFFIPQLLYALNYAIPHIVAFENNADSWDALIFFVQVIIGLSILLYSWNKKYRHGKE